MFHRTLFDFQRPSLPTKNRSNLLLKPLSVRAVAPKRSFHGDAPYWDCFSLTQHDRHLPPPTVQASREPERRHEKSRQEIPLRAAFLVWFWLFATLVSRPVVRYRRGRNPRGSSSRYQSRTDTGASRHCALLGARHSMLTALAVSVSWSSNSLTFLLQHPL